LSRLGWIKSLIALACSCVAACSLIFDASDIDQGCPGNQKFCESEGRCVDRSPAYGCGADCTPCIKPNAIPDCQAEECVIRACVWGFTSEGDSNPPKECSINFLVNHDRCGPPPNTKACDADQICVNGVCSSTADDSLQ
jgi:hypothetical protein